MLLDGIYIYFFFYVKEIVEPCLYLLPFWLSHFHNNMERLIASTTEALLNEKIPTHKRIQITKPKKKKISSSLSLPLFFSPNPYITWILTFTCTNAFLSWIKYRFEWFRTLIKIINRKLYMNFESVRFIIKCWLRSPEGYVEQQIGLCNDFIFITKEKSEEKNKNFCYRMRCERNK